MRLFLLLNLLLVTLTGCAQNDPDIIYQTEGNAVHVDGNGLAYFYAGDACFWCTESIWDDIHGVMDVKSGYLGGTRPESPTYSFHGNYAEGNKILYNPAIVSLEELIDYYFLFHSHGHSPDRGSSYRAVIHIPGKYYLDQVQSKVRGKFYQQIIIGQINWFDAEDYHQNYVARLQRGEKVQNPQYGLNESIPRKNAAIKKYKEYILERDNVEAHAIMVKGRTEGRFTSPLNNEKRAGYYVSAATGDTLFVSTDKFDSGTGWPSFDDATNNVAIGKAEQGGHEVIEKSTGYHLGHLFKNEGFTDKESRYCINGDALIFVPKAGSK